MNMGTVEDFTNFINAVIDETSFDKLETYIKLPGKKTARPKFWQEVNAINQLDILLNLL
jgi:hypothetical protein